MQTEPITPTAPAQPSAPQNPSSAQNANQATNAFGLSFDSLLRIILTQLTYQDPLKPMDNFQFVSQLAQFAQVQQGQTSNDRLQQLVAATGVSQATGLLGQLVDVAQGDRTLAGRVTAIAFQNGAPTLTIETDDKQTISNLPLSGVTQVRRGN
ncbi:MAG: flagellar hook capping protein [Sphingomonas sp.]|nr:flagellar hook capping protein [Sphingomonas sp.]